MAFDHLIQLVAGPHGQSMTTFDRAHPVGCSGLLLLDIISSCRLDFVASFQTFLQTFVSSGIDQMLDVGVPTSLARIRNDPASVFVLMLFVMTCCSCVRNARPKRSTFPTLIKESDPGTSSGCHASVGIHHMWAC